MTAACINQLRLAVNPTISLLSLFQNIFQILTSKMTCGSTIYIIQRVKVGLFFTFFFSFSQHCTPPLSPVSSQEVLTSNYLVDSEERILVVPLKIRLSAIGTIPGSRGQPKIVWVLPEPLGPSAASIPLLPFKKSSTKGFTIFSYTSPYN